MFLYPIFVLLSSISEICGFFKSIDSINTVNTNQLNYGVAVSDVDGDGVAEWVVAGYNGPNMVLKYHNSTYANPRYANLAVEENPEFFALADQHGKSIGVVACDINGDNREEIFFVNTNYAYGGSTTYRHSLFTYRNGHYVDLFNDPINLDQQLSVAGRSAACIDRKGTGIYSILIATYASKGVGKFAVIEMDPDHPENRPAIGQIVIREVAEQIGIKVQTGGRAVVAGPILNNGGLQDVFFLNEANNQLGNVGYNNLFMNKGDGTFVDVANDYGVNGDKEGAGRGLVLEDINNDGWLDLIWAAYPPEPNRLYLRKGRSFVDHSEMLEPFAKPLLSRNLMAADFDNDGNLELFFNSIVDITPPASNRLLQVFMDDDDDDVDMKDLDPGDAMESEMHGTGGAYADIDGDGVLEMLLSHGESKKDPLTLYKAAYTEGNNWLRIAPLTLYGAPARGALVNLTMTDGTFRIKVIDGGSGYLCQMEPVAHFGLGMHLKPLTLKVMWPGGSVLIRSMKGIINSLIKINHPDLDKWKERVHMRNHIEL